MRLLITGGAGFIGSNTADAFLSDGHQITVFDDLSRAGTELNLSWLQSNHPGLRFVRGDITQIDQIQAAFDVSFDAVIHLAAQTAVTTSITEPARDFQINALGTFNLLEAVRISGQDPVVIYASTNKVYGGMETVAVVEEERRYRYLDYPLGIREDLGLDFHSPYGCSKGAADQYVRDYARMYGLRTIVYRQSCIYGERQFGIEDQGWVAWFILAARAKKQITIFGNGKQVRDVLHIQDLVAAYKVGIERADQVAGRIYNIGGGPEFSLSIWIEFREILEKLLEQEIPVTTADWRPGDQPIYVSDITKAKNELGWSPTISPEQGIKRLYEWIDGNVDLFKQAGLL